MELYEENKSEYLEKKSTEKGLIKYDPEIHLINIIHDVVYEKGEKDGLEKFEEISYKQKLKARKQNFQYELPKTVAQYKPELSVIEENAFKANPKKKFREISTHPSLMEDLMYKAQLLEWGGVSFNKMEWYKLKTSIEKLLLDSKALHIRFWGKIFGTTSDYYILQGTLRSYPSMSYLPKSIERPGIEGLNKYTFWYSDACMEEWFELPLVSSEQMRAARLFKYQLTGDPEAEVHAFNIFPWPEVYLLKCQVLRIMHGASICPADYQKMGQGEGDFEERITIFNDEYNPANNVFEEMSSPALEKWIHEYASILQAGSIIQEKKGDEDSPDKYLPRMQSIKDDEGFGGENNPAWNIRVIGDNQTYSQSAGKEGTVNYAAVVIRSLRWPGSLCVYKNNEHVNIYVGSGIKYGGSVFIPTEPEEVENDPEGIDEFPEPNPDKEPIIIEPDTDEEKEPGEEDS